MATTIALLNNILTCFMDNHTLGPLHDFTTRIRGIRPGGLTSIRVDRSILPRFGRFDGSFGDVVGQLSRNFSTRHRFAKGTTRRLQAPLTLARTRVRLFTTRRPSIRPRATRFLGLLRRRARQVSRVAGALLRVDRLHSIPYGSEVRLTPVVRRVVASLRPVTRRGKVTLGCSNGNAVVNDSALVCELVFGLARGTVQCGHTGTRIRVSIYSSNSGVSVHIHSGNRNVPRRCERDVFRPFFHVSGSHDETRNKMNLKLSLI